MVTTSNRSSPEGERLVNSSANDAVNHNLPDQAKPEESGTVMDLARQKVDGAIGLIKREVELQREKSNSMCRLRTAHNWVEDKEHFRDPNDPNNPDNLNDPDDPSAPNPTITRIDFSNLELS